MRRREALRRPLSRPTLTPIAFAVAIGWGSVVLNCFNRSQSRRHSEKPSHSPGFGIPLVEPCTCRTPHPAHIACPARALLFSGQSTEPVYYQTLLYTLEGILVSAPRAIARPSAPASSASHTRSHPRSFSPPCLSLLSRLGASRTGRHNIFSSTPRIPCRAMSKAPRLCRTPGPSVHFSCLLGSSTFPDLPPLPPHLERRPSRRLALLLRNASSRVSCASIAWHVAPLADLIEPISAVAFMTTTQCGPQSSAEAHSLTLPTGASVSVHIPSRVETLQ